MILAGAAARDAAPPAFDASGQMGEITDSDIWHVANWIVDRHGEIALIQATLRADACFARGEIDKAVLWLRIRSAATALLPTLADHTLH